MSQRYSVRNALPSYLSSRDDIYSMSSLSIEHWFFMLCSHCRAIRNVGVILSRYEYAIVTRIWSFEFRAKLVQILVDSHLSAEASTMSTEDYTMTPEPHTMTSEPNTKVLWRYGRSLSEGHTNATRWLYDVVLRVWCVRRTRRRHVISRS